MNNYFADQEIDKMFEEIKSKIVNGSIYGKKIEEYDIKAMVVGAFYMGLEQSWRVPHTSIQRIGDDVI